MTDATADLRRLLGEATPGPWRVTGTEVAPHWYVSSPDVLVHGPALERADHVPETINRWIADARLIAAAVNALPALLDAAEAARKFVEFCETEVPHWKPLTTEERWEYYVQYMGRAQAALKALR